MIASKVSSKSSLHAVRSLTTFSVKLGSRNNTVDTSPLSSNTVNNLYTGHDFELSKRIQQHQTVSDKIVVTSRCFSTQPQTEKENNNGTNSNSSPVNLDDFEYPRAKDLYQRIIAQCQTEAEVTQLGSYTLSLLGSTFRQNEFYYRGFGGGKQVGAGKGEDDEAAAVAEPVKTAFDLRLCSFDAKNKIKVIKEVRAIAGLGLKEAKELVESALPKVVLKNVSKEQGEEFIKTLQGIGAELELA